MSFFSPRRPQEPRKPDKKIRSLYLRTPLARSLPHYKITQPFSSLDFCQEQGLFPFFSSSCVPHSTLGRERVLSHVPSWCLST